MRVTATESRALGRGVQGAEPWGESRSFRRPKKLVANPCPPWGESRSFRLKKKTRPLKLLLPVLFLEAHVVEETL